MSGGRVWCNRGQSCVHICMSMQRVNVFAGRGLVLGNLRDYTKVQNKLVFVGGMQEIWFVTTKLNYLSAQEVQLPLIMQFICWLYVKKSCLKVTFEGCFSIGVMLCRSLVDFLNYTLNFIAVWSHHEFTVGVLWLALISQPTFCFVAGSVKDTIPVQTAPWMQWQPDW